MKKLCDKIKNKSVFLTFILIIAASLNTGSVIFSNNIQFKKDILSSYENLSHKLENCNIVNGHLYYEGKPENYSDEDFAIGFLMDSEDIPHKNCIVFQDDTLDIILKGQVISIKYEEILKDNNINNLQEVIHQTLSDVLDINVRMSFGYPFFYILLAVAILSMIALYFVNKAHGMLSYKNIWNITSLLIFISSFIGCSLAIIFKLQYIYINSFIIILTALLQFKQTILNYKQV